MSVTFKGQIDRLQKRVRDCTVFGEWSGPISGSFEFSSTDGEILKWCLNTGVISFEGQSGPLQRRFTAVFAD